MSRPQPGIVCSDLAFAWPDGTPVFAGLALALDSDRVGLVAPNGAGKSTLLRLVAGELRPTAGAIAVSGRLAYLPQSLNLEADRSVAEILGVAPALTALRAIEAGDTREETFAAVGDDWDVEERTTVILGQLGLADVGLARTVGTLSGGQATLLGLASRLLQQPDVLLLDEPSNNLDIDARERLYGVIADWRGCLLIASHDRDLLGRVDRIAELAADGVRLYGGAFDDYEAAVAVAQAAAEQAVRTAELDVKREKREAQEARERSDRRASAGKRRARSGGMPPIVAGAMQRKAEASAGRAGDLHERRFEAAKDRLARERQALRDEERMRIALPQTRVPAARVLFAAEGATAALAGGAPLFGPAGIDLTIRGPERIALIGANGAGKTTLLRLIAGDRAPDAGRVRRYNAATIRTLPQRLDWLDDDASVLANL
ncbi:MAG TPA: ATP-binding cassette domain-containing protein, partial [Thermomicrobiales bacterium]|nr:ATP-binding cassette domain-containing protein [Thermomicrobiales bacterium]